MIAYFLSYLGVFMLICWKNIINLFFVMFEGEHRGYRSERKRNQSMLGAKRKKIINQFDEDIFNLGETLTNSQKNDSVNNNNMHSGLVNSMRSRVQAVGITKNSFFQNGDDHDQYIGEIKPALKKQENQTKSRKHRKRNSEHRLPKKENNFLDFSQNFQPISIHVPNNEPDTTIEQPQVKIEKKSKGKQVQWLDESPLFKKKPKRDFKIDFSTKEDLFFEEIPPSFKNPEEKQQTFSSTPQYQFDDILDPSYSMLQKQKEITQIYFEDQSIDSGPFVVKCIPEGARLLFQAKVENSDIFRRQFSFWLDSEGEGKVLLMNAKKNMKIGKNQYYIQNYNEYLRLFSYLAKIENIFEANKFIISNEQKIVSQKDAQVFGQVNIFSKTKGKPTMALYYPQFDRNNHEQLKKPFLKDSFYLSTMMHSTSSEVQYLSYCQLDALLEKRVMREHCLVKTSKTIALKDKEGSIKLYIGKIQSKKYKIIAGSGISPLLIFAFFIVMVNDA